jgi:hypothetical protein
MNHENVASTPAENAPTSQLPRARRVLEETATTPSTIGNTVSAIISAAGMGAPRAAITSNPVGPAPPRHEDIQANGSVTQNTTNGTKRRTRLRVRTLRRFVDSMIETLASLIGACVASRPHRSQLTIEVPSTNQCAGAEIVRAIDLARVDRR